MMGSRLCGLLAPWVVLGSCLSLLGCRHNTHRSFTIMGSLAHLLPEQRS